MKLSALEAKASFALLGPGFSEGEWTLLEGLEPSSEGALVFAAYESGPEFFEAKTLSKVEPDFDCEPACVDPRLDESGHREAVESIRASIAAGDVYQVNHTLRARLEECSGASLLSLLCRRGLPRFAAWVRLPDGRELVSASPELFFSLDGRRIVAEPMKGTARADEEGRLETSVKDRAELAMITDLLRNDLNVVCEPKSVRVLSERRFIRLPYAVQTVSEIEGRLRDEVSLVEVLSALHPGGSITGAPKRAAMRRISELETSPRGAYCGALGFRQKEKACFSLLIRTAERARNGWVYGVGGGIVWDSSPEEELAEARLKLGALR